MRLRFENPACALLLLSALLAPCVATGALQAQAPTAAQQHQTSTPYSGDLSIFEYKDREKKLQIERVMDLLGIKPGVSVADIGAGSGWFTARASKRTGATGTVYAEDINPESLKAIADRAQKEGLANVRAIEGTPDDPKLPMNSVDAVLMLKVYHEIAHTDRLLRNLKNSLRPGAKIGIIDRNGTGADHGLEEAIVVKEMATAGFERVGRYDFTKADGQDYFLIFTARQQ